MNCGTEHSVTSQRLSTTDFLTITEIGAEFERVGELETEYSIGIDDIIPSDRQTRVC